MTIHDYGSTVIGIIFFAVLGLSIQYQLTKAAVRNGTIEAHREINSTSTYGTKS